MSKHPMNDNSQDVWELQEADMRSVGDLDGMRQRIRKCTHSPTTDSNKTAGQINKERGLPKP